MTDVSTRSVDQELVGYWNSKLAKVRKFPTLYSISFFLFLSSFSFIPVQAMENASFNSEQNTLTIPALSFSGQGSYFVEMHLSQTEPNVIFDVAKAEENGEVSSNEAYFSIDSGLLNIANLDIAGDSWIVTLEQLGSSSQFQVISASASPGVSITEIVNSKGKSVV